MTSAVDPLGMSILHSHNNVTLNTPRTNWF